MNYYLVGGCVRDELMGKKPKDIDLVAIGGSYEELKNDLLENHNAVIFLERPEFLALRCKTPKFGACDIVLARADGFYSNGRKPDSVILAKTIEEDLARRDATCNAIAKDLSTGKYVDPFGGINDITNKTLRAVGNPLERIKEDSLRVFRYIRFNLTLRFQLEPSLQEAILNANHHADFSNVSNERVYEEVRKMFEFDSFLAFEVMRQVPWYRFFVLSRLNFMPLLKPVDKK